MTAGPNINSTGCKEKLVNALRDEAKQLEAAIYSNEIWEKSLEVVCKRIASGEVSDNMLLHVVLSLSKSIAVFKLHRRTGTDRDSCAHIRILVTDWIRFDSFGRTKPNSLIKSDQ
jgi:hypothetical protein